MDPSSTTRRNTLLLTLLLFLAAGIAAYSWYQIDSLTNELAETKAQEAELSERLAEAEELRTENQNLQERNDEMSEQIIDLQDQLDEREEDLEEAEEENEDLREQVEEVTQSVDTLQNTVSTDPELLKKYSRTYFLSENYKPESLAQIDQEYLYDDNSLTVLDKMWPRLEDMLEAAHDDDVNLLVNSAYRPFDEQARLNDRYTRVYGTGANRFSAEQGYSEHQLGTAVDFTTPEVGSNFNGFGSTEAFEWLQENAHEYGFILSYPQDNQYYQYEPWHWRFVGEELAEDLEEANAHFYDWDQREIDAYRSELFE